LTKFFPVQGDPWWNTEVSKIVDFTAGYGIDLGCGGRTIKRGSVLLDKDSREDVFQHDLEDMPWPFRDDTFNWASFIHVLHYLQNPVVAVSEALRIVKPNGYILIVLPDVNYITPEDAATFIWRPEPVGFFSVLRQELELGRVIMADVAQPSWSFFMIIQKHMHSVGERFEHSHPLRR